MWENITEVIQIEIDPSIPNSIHKSNNWVYTAIILDELASFILLLG